MRTCLYPGTFDPITMGHVDVVTRAGRLFDKVVVGVADATGKQPLFSYAERIALTKEAIGGLPFVEVLGFSQLTVTFARQVGACAVLRGVRAVSDFDYELQLASMNRHLDEELETVFFVPTERYAYLSSTLVRQVTALGGDVSALVPPNVARALSCRMQADRRA